MNRNDTRMIAVKLLYSTAYAQIDSDMLVEEFFSEEHYATLADEEELFTTKPNKDQLEYIKNILTLTVEHQCEIDELISRYSSGRRIERISKTALAVLRCALCEILYFEDIPVSVSINEAVEIAKNYDDADTVSFINGILGSVARDLSNADSDAE